MDPDSTFGECFLRFVARRYRECVELGLPALGDPLADPVVTQLVLISTQRLGDADGLARVSARVQERYGQIRSVRAMSEVESWQHQMIQVILGKVAAAASLGHSLVDHQTMELHYLWGSTAMAAGQNPEAAHHFDVCLDLASGPYFILARTDKMSLAGKLDPIGAGLGSLLFDQGPESSGRALNKGKVRKDVTTSFRLLADALKSSDAYRHDFVRAEIEKLTKDAMEIGQRGNLSRGLELLAEASKTIEEAPGTFPVLTAELNFSRARLLSKSNRWPEALELFERNLATLRGIFGNRHRRTMVARAEVANLRRKIGERTARGG